MHDCAVGRVSANGVKAQFHKVFALSAKRLQCVGKRDFAHLHLAHVLFEIAHKFDHSHTVFHVRFADIADFHGVFARFA